MRTLIIVRGLPGAGKTTIAKLLAQLPNTMAIATDEYPGLYLDGVYQNHLQKISHEWCFESVRTWMENGLERIIIHNTFTQVFYMQQYLEAAKEHDYAVHIIHSEAVLIDSLLAQSEHDVPTAVLESMAEKFEPFRPAPKKGATIADIAFELTGLSKPDIIIFDMDGTIKITASKEVFAQTPSDFVIKPQFEDWARHYGQRPHKCDLYIVSNQRGLSKGSKKPEFLHEEVELLTKKLNQLEFDIRFQDCYFADGDNSLSCWRYSPSINEWEKITNTISPYDKPNIGAYQHILSQRFVTRDIWIVGDAHTDAFSSDWRFAKNCQLYTPTDDVRYIPIDFLQIAWSLVDE